MVSMYIQSLTGQAVPTYDWRVAAQMGLADH